MASITKRVSSKGAETCRVSYYRDGQVHWTPTIESGDGAVIEWVAWRRD